jgi:hypothetical protein
MARQPFQGVAVKAEAPFSLKMARVADLLLANFHIDNLTFTDLPPVLDQSGHAASPGLSSERKPIPGNGNLREG